MYLFMVTTVFFYEYSKSRTRKCQYTHSCKREINDQSMEEEVSDTACWIATENIISSWLHVHEPIG